MKTAANFKVMDIKRLIHAARSSGVEIARVEIEPGSGKITVVVGEAVETVSTDGEGWEDVIDKNKVKVRS